MRIRRTAVLLGAVTVLAAGIGACGESDSTATGDGSSSSATGTDDAPAGGNPSSTAAALDPDAPSTTDPGATAVPGPRLPPAVRVPLSKRAPNIVGTRCETAGGPEGALRVVIFPGASASCGVVMPVAKKYGPLISTGRDQAVGGWDCGPSQTQGVLAKCSRGSDSFGLVPQ